MSERYKARNDEIRKLYNSSDMPFEQLGEKYQLSRQAISVIVSRGKQMDLLSNAQVRTIRKCVYPNIGQYMLDNRITLYDFCRKIEEKEEGTLKLPRFLLGNGSLISLDMVDKILEYTGMKYEEAFKKCVDTVN